LCDAAMARRSRSVAKICCTSIKGSPSHRTAVSLKGRTKCFALCLFDHSVRFDRKQFYVTMSRVRMLIFMFTDSIAGLREAVLRKGERLCALEIVPDLQSEHAKGLHGIKKEPATVDLHAGARKTIMADEPRINAAIEQSRTTSRERGTTAEGASLSHLFKTATVAESSKRHGVACPAIENAAREFRPNAKTRSSDSCKLYGITRERARSARVQAIGRGAWC
jgi:hypothetical protein